MYGCTSQFKSKTPFWLLSMEKTPWERIYFGSRHGKSSCDSLGGIVKKKAEAYVKTSHGKIRNPLEFFNFCEHHLVIDGEEECLHKRRVFFFIDDLERPDIPSSLRPLPGTHKIHQVRGISPGVIQARRCACFCVGCVVGSECHETGSIDSEWMPEHSLNKAKGDMKEKGQKSKSSADVRYSKGSKQDIAEHSVPKNTRSQSASLRRIKIDTHTSKRETRVTTRASMTLSEPSRRQVRSSDNKEPDALRVRPTCRQL